MSSRRLVEEGHYKSQDYHYDCELLRTRVYSHQDIGKAETFEFTVYEDAAGFLKVTLEVYYHYGYGDAFTNLTKVTSRNPPAEMTLDIHVKSLGYVEEADETKRMYSKFSNKITSDDFVKKDGEKFHEVIPNMKFWFKGNLSYASKYNINMGVTYVRYKRNGASLTKAMQNLHLDQATSDLTILCDSETLPCHKVILATRSDVFKAMFDAKSGFAELQDGVLEIEDFDAHTMKVFLEYMYMDSIKTEDINCKVLMAAHKYNFERLFSECSQHLMLSISKENVIEIIKCAHLLNTDELFRKAVLAITKMDREEIKEDLDVLSKDCPEIFRKIFDSLAFGAN